MGKQAKEQQRKSNETRHQFLLTFFNQIENHYEELPVNGYYLVKQWNGNTQRWEVAIYTPKSYEKKQQFTKVPVGEVSDDTDKLPF